MQAENKITITFDENDIQRTNQLDTIFSEIYQDYLITLDNYDPNNIQDFEKIDNTFEAAREAINELVDLICE